MTSVMWQPQTGAGAERAVIEATTDGFRIAGTALIVSNGAAHEIRYSVLTDRTWHTRTVGAHVQGPGADRRLALHADGSGAWSVGDAPLMDLFGAIDVDLGWTPATNTLPIRRLGLEIGASEEVTVAWVAFPDHEVRRRRQRYERLSDEVYRFASDDFQVELTVDDSGIVTDYPGGWRAVTLG